MLEKINKIKQMMSIPQAERALKMLKKIDWKEYCVEMAEGVRMARAISVKHADGSVFEFRSAICRRVNDWIFILTEHHGDFMYQETDIDWVKESINPRFLYEDKAEYHYLNYEWDESINDEDKEEVIEFESLISNQSPE